MNWILRLGPYEYPCEVQTRDRDILKLRLGQVVAFGTGRLCLLFPPSSEAPFVVVTRTQETTDTLEFALLGVLRPASRFCVKCGSVLEQFEVVGRVPGLRWKNSQDVCYKCFEVEAARQLRTPTVEKDGSAVEDEATAFEDLEEWAEFMRSRDRTDGCG